MARHAVAVAEDVDEDEVERLADVAIAQLRSPSVSGFTLLKRKE